MLNLRTLADDARIEITGRDLKALYAAIYRGAEV